MTIHSRPGAEAPSPAARPATPQDKADKWDHLISLLQSPKIRDSYIWRLASQHRAVNLLLAYKEDLPPALIEQLQPYKEKLEALRLEAIDGFDGTQGVLNFFPTYITESLIGQLSHDDRQT